MPEFPALRTERLLLRQLSRRDLDSIFFLRSDPGVNRFIMREPTRNVSDAEAWLDRITRAVDEGKSFNWAITFPDDGKMVGSVCLWNFSPDRSVAELGYDLHPAFHGKGVMQEATGAVLEHGFQKLGLRVVEAFTSRHNAPSIKLLLKKGFRLDEMRTDPDNSDNRIFILNNLEKS